MVQQTEVCACSGISYPQGKIGGDNDYFPSGTILEVEIWQRGKRLGSWPICPACDEDHHLCNFIIGAYVVAGFDARCGNIFNLHHATTIVKLCREHCFVRIQLD